MLKRRAIAQFAISAGVSLLLALVLLGYEVHVDGQMIFSYLPWNLSLAVLPLVFAGVLLRSLRRHRWSDWQPLGWTLLWALFLPNSFYMISDYIHLQEVSPDRVLYISVLFTAFILLGVIFGYASLYLVHDQLRRRLRAVPAALLIGVLLLLCSFAIYIGRDLRWNSWDVILSPAGLLFDVSDRLLKPELYHSMLGTVASFFVLLAALYGVIWSGLELLRKTYGFSVGTR